METNHRKLVILQHNVRHWATNKFSYYNIYKEVDPDLIMINEHGMKNEEKIKLFGYDVYQINKTNDLHDGVAIGIKRTLKYKIIDDFEESVLAVKLQTEIGEVTLRTVYQPPRRNYLPFDDVTKLLNDSNPTYIMADMNAKHRIYGDNRNNAVGDSLAELTNRGKIINMGPDFPTYLGVNSMTILDRVYCNNKGIFNYTLEPGPLTVSDHIPVLLTLSTVPLQKELKRPRFQMNKADWMTFKEKFINYQGKELQGQPIDIIDDELCRVMNEIKKNMDSTIPKTKYKTLPYATINEDIRRVKIQFDEIKKHLNRYGNDLNKIRRMRELQVQLRELYKDQQKEKWERMINKTNELTDSKSFWTNIRKLQGTDKPKTPYIIKPDGSKAYTEREIEIQMREEWGRIFKITEEDNEDFDMEHEGIVMDFMTDNIDRTLPLESINFDNLNEIGEITEGEYYHHLRKFKEKTPGQSGITRNVLLNLPGNITKVIIKLFNAALATGYFPDPLKIAKMIFIPKEGKDLKRRENYRPISLLEMLGKILEKIINKRILTILKRLNRINKRHHGFMTERGTRTALAIITERIAQAKKQRNQVNLILRDVSKAFDRVWHLGLQMKILQLGLPSLYERILCDYVRDRQAFIQIENYNGPKFDIECGVPQGSCLSPTLYLIYTSDMPEPAPYSEHLMFADDVTQLVIYPGKSTEIMSNHTGEAIENINRYEKKWKIKTNINKFKVIPLAKRVTSPLIVEGNVMDYSSQGTVLGLKVTGTGYSSFIKEKKQRAQDILSKLQRFRNLSEKNKKKLYLALIRSVLEYPPVPLNTVSKTRMKDLQTIQNKALRFIYNIKYTDYITNEELHRRAELPTIEQLIKERATVTWEKITELELATDLLERDEEGGREHFWFRESRTRV